MMLTMVGEGESVLRIPAFSKTFLLTLNDNSRRLGSFWGILEGTMIQGRRGVLEPEFDEGENRHRRKLGEEISYVGFSQILAFSLVNHSDHSGIFRVFSGSW